MKRKLIIKIILVMFVMLIALSISQISNAAVLQSNPTTYSSAPAKMGYIWITMIRDMETSGQAMGLSATINSTSLLDSSESNNIDVHMMKSTEYGAMVILSSSGFGNPANTKTIDTTTGNKTGVYIKSEKAEWVAGALSNAVGMSGTSRAHRYFNTYTSSSSSAKPGDALDLGWHGATRTWRSDNTWAFFRGGSFGLFGYNNIRTNDGTYQYCARAVVVNGVGF